MEEAERRRQRMPATRMPGGCWVGLLLLEEEVLRQKAARVMEAVVRSVRISS